MKRDIHYGGRSYEADVQVDEWEIIRALVGRATKSKTRTATALGGAVKLTLKGDEA